jgi:hypothetical protein
VSCAAGSAQEQWLRADLAAHPTACTLAYLHHPRFSSGASHGDRAGLAELRAYVDSLWQDVLGAFAASADQEAALEEAGKSGGPTRK